MHGHRGALAGVHGQLEDVGSVVVANGVEIAAGGPDGGVVGVGVQDGLLVAGGPRKNLSGRVDDHAVT
jgi:hypothetical protein